MLKRKAMGFHIKEMVADMKAPGVTTSQMVLEFLFMEIKSSISVNIK